MHKGRYCFKVKRISWQNIRRDKQWDSMGSGITKEKKINKNLLYVVF